MQSYSFVKLTKLSCCHLEITDSECWSSIMKAVLLIACICIASAAPGRDHTVTKFSEAFRITKDEARHCIDKTNVVEADVEALLDQFTVVSEVELLKQSDTRRAICSIACAAQAQGIMIGAEINPDEIHAFVEEIGTSIPKYIRATMHDTIDICAKNAKEATDECQATIKFAMCLIDVNSTF